MKSQDRSLFLKAFLIRQVEQELLQLFGKGHVAGTIHTCLGQEFTGIALAESLEKQDWVFSNHRCHGHYLSRYPEDFGALIAEILGRPSGVCRGFGGSQHLYRPGFMSSGIQGGMIPAAVGLAQALKRDGKNAVVAAFLGDGTLGQGVVYESMNLASLLKSPIVFILENNSYAQSTAQAEYLAGSIEGRAQAFRIPYFKTNTWDPRAAIQTMKAAVQLARDEQSPAFVEIETYRLGPHSKGDDFRAKSELDQYQEKDPLNTYVQAHSNDLEWTKETQAIREKVSAAIERALKEPLDVQVSTPTRTKLPTQSHSTRSSAGNQAKEINHAIHEAMTANSRMMFLGEDLRDPYGGAFKISAGLSTAWPDRVINMPISEASIVGVSLGLALGGRPVIAEIMFGDFVAIAFDQILNHASKFQSMYGEPMRVPMLIRTPMGGGRGYGSTHSQSLEKYLAGIPGVELYILHPRANADAVYSELLAGLEQLTIVIENKLLYNRSSEDALPAGYRLIPGNSAIDASILCHENGNVDLTVVSFGGIGIEVEKAAVELAKDELALEIFLPTKINASPDPRLMESVLKSRRLLVVEEGTAGYNLGTQLLTEVLEKIPTHLRSQIEFKLVAAKPCAIPAARYLESQVLPTAESIRLAALELYER